MAASRRGRVIGTPVYIRYVDPDGLWPNLRSLVLSEVQRRPGDRVTSEIRCHISSMPADARAPLQAGTGYLGKRNPCQLPMPPLCSHDCGQGVPARIVVNAWAAAPLVLGQRTTDARANEITTIP